MNGFFFFGLFVLLFERANPNAMIPLELTCCCCCCCCSVCEIAFEDGKGALAGFHLSVVMQRLEGYFQPERERGSGGSGGRGVCVFVDERERRRGLLIDEVL
jgi:hypothetical protein